MMHLPNNILIERQIDRLDLNKMSEGLFRQRGLLATVFGAGIFIGATGFFLILRLLEERKKRLSNRLQDEYNENEVDEEINSTRFSHLSSRRLSLQSSSSRSSRHRRNGMETDDEMYSAIGSENEEFFDITSDEELSLWSFSETKKVEDDENILNLLEEVDVLLKGGDEDRLNALKLLMQEENTYSNNSNFLWRMAKAYQMQAISYGSKKDLAKKKEFINKGLTCAGNSLAIDPENPDAHKWYAILLGMKSEFLPVKDKIQNGYNFQKHLLEALKCKPNDYSLYHLLGRFKYEIANLSWVEKKVASTLFAELPTVTLEDAISDFEKSEELSPLPWKENRLLLAKCHIGNRNYTEAMKWLTLAKEVSPQTNDEATCDEECESLLLKYKKYADKK